MGELAVLEQKVIACESRIKRLEDEMKHYATATTELRMEMKAIKTDIEELKGAINRSFESVEKSIERMETKMENKLPDANDQVKFYQKLVIIFISIFATMLGAAYGFKSLMKLPF